MEKKTEKKNVLGYCVMYGFWVMIALLVLMILFSFLKWSWPNLIVGILFIVSVLFVLVSSIKTIAPPEKSMAYIALSIAILFITLFLVYMLIYGLSYAASGSASGALG